MRYSIGPSNRGDRLVSAVIFGVAATAVSYVVAGDSNPTDDCINSITPCDFRHGVAATWALGVVVVVAALFGLNEVRRKLRPPAPGERSAVPADQRIAVALLVLVAAVFIAFLHGTDHFSSTYCGPRNTSGGDECDLAAIEGFEWALGAAFLVVAGVIAHEAQLYRRRQRTALRGP